MLKGTAKRHIILPVHPQLSNDTLPILRTEHCHIRLINDSRWPWIILIPLNEESIDYGTDHFTCFQFDYDWRQDIAANAESLEEFIAERRAFVQKKYKEEFGIENAPVKFDIVAHSMGSLLSRYYLRYGAQSLPSDGGLPELNWAGAQDIERAILVAPPNAGSLEAFGQLLDGFNTGRPVLPFYSPIILGTFPSAKKPKTVARAIRLLLDRLHAKYRYKRYYMSCDTSVTKTEKAVATAGLKPVG